MFRVKVIILGPCKSGKTILSNYIADATDISDKKYHPTQGVRILEFESSEIELSEKSVKADVELWDCSGDKKFESCWPAIIRETNGVIINYNPAETTEESEIKFWHSVVSEVPDSNILLLCNQYQQNTSNDSNKINGYSGLWTQTFDMEQDAENIHVIFKKFLKKLLQKMADGRDRDELNIMSEGRIQI